MADPIIIKVTLVRSPIGTTGRQRQTLRGLGLIRIGQTLVVHDNAPTQGRIRRVRHLIEVQR